ncbi:MAG: diaminopimelate decarboxylase [Firmicutes bacterium]|nr:diaminopimelate decarboxylase [Bacillota bacterium]
MGEAKLELYRSIQITSDGELEIGGCRATRLARDFGTPLHVMDEEMIRAKSREIRTSLLKYYPKAFVAYASKAFCTLAMCRLIHEESLGLDVCSGGELFTALEAGIPPENILFHGNCKTRQEIEMGVRVGVGRFIIDNLDELDLLSEVSRKSRKRTHVQIRLNPGVEAHTHDYIKTGLIDSKFGLGITDGQAMKAVERVLASEYLVLEGVHSHIGSQILNVEPFVLAAQVVMDFAGDVKEKFGYSLREVNLGGGFGVRYKSCDTPLSIDEYSKRVSQVIRESCHTQRLDLPCVMVEPGRYIVGEAGTTLYTVCAIKDIPGLRKYIMVDGGMSENPRVALYQAEYEAVLANKATEEPTETVSIAGKHCEEGDMLVVDAKMPQVKPGDLLALLTTGAYHYSMASNYNRYPRPAVIFAKAGLADIVVERETYANLVARDRMPARLAQVDATGIYPHLPAAGNPR